MMQHVTDFLFIPHFVAVPLYVSTNFFDESLLHPHLVSPIPIFTPVILNENFSVSNWPERFRFREHPPYGSANRKYFLSLLRKLQLTEEQLVSNSFPRWKNSQRTNVVVQPSLFDIIAGRVEFVPDNDTRRRCVRCHAPYRLPHDGKKRVDFCIHHSKPALNSGMKIHPCCGRPMGVAGCQYSQSHVTDTMRESLLSDFYATPEPTSPWDPRSETFYALDCEFVYTTWGKEPARITLVDEFGAHVIDCVFRTEHELVDPNTQYSGLTTEEVESNDLSLEDVRELLFEKVNSQTVLIGHALENDLKALRIVHDTIVDTSVLFSRSNIEGRLFKRSLKSLAREKLAVEIQSEDSGHDSGEDAWAAMQLVVRAVETLGL